MDSPCIAMNEPPKFGKKHVPKHAPGSSHGWETPWEPHSDREICLGQQLPGWDGDGIRAAWHSHTAGFEDSSGTPCPVMLIFVVFYT